MVKLTTDRLLLAAGVASVVAGACLLVAPGAVSALGPLDALTDTAAWVGLLVGLVVAVLAAFQMRKTAQETLDRSSLLPAPPERARDARVPAPSAPLAQSYRRLGNGIERFGQAGWRVVAYGRRARDTVDRPAENDHPDQSREDGHRGSAGGDGRRDQRRPPVRNGREDQQPERGRHGRPVGRDVRDLPPENRQPSRPAERPQGAARSRGTGGQPFGHRGSSRLLALLDEVALTARDTYAAATGCDEETAERAVETGEWTDDRIAAAFLATEQGAPSFTRTERALAWLAPQRTFDRRLGQTLDAVETHAEGFLTYRTPSTDRTGTDGDETGTGEVGMGDRGGDSRGMRGGDSREMRGGDSRGGGAERGGNGTGVGQSNDRVPAGPAGEERQ